MSNIVNVVIPENLSDEDFDKGIETNNKIKVKQRFTISNLKTSTNIPKLVFITDSNKEGWFLLDETDTTSVNDDVNIIVTSTGKRYKKKTNQVLPNGTSSQVILGDKTLGTLNKSLVGLDNIDNTSDLSKPVSTATQAELNKGYTLAQLQALTNVIAGKVYYCIDSGKEGNFKADLTDTTSADNTGIILVTSNNVRLKREINNGEINVKWFGAIGDSVTDDTVAIKNAILYAFSKKIYPAPLTTSSNGVGRISINLGTGGYLITAPLLTSTDISGRTEGFTLKGSGGLMSQIIYRPTTSAPLIYNNDVLMQVRIEGINFDCNDLNSSLLYSYSTGGTQDYRFQDCTFGGSWLYGVRLKGNNCNSEMSFEKCWFRGIWTSFLQSEDSDQFLNYWFTECKYWCSSPWITMVKGGNVKISNCDISGYIPSTYTYLFNLMGNVHSSGVCSFVCNNTRFELKNINAGVLYSEWEQGNILFSGCDMSSQATLVSLFNTVTIKINLTCPVIKWNNCSLMGTHTYASLNANAFSYINKISYDTCSMLQTQRPEEFILRTHVVNKGGRVTVDLKNCIGKTISNIYEVFDSSQGWLDTARSITSRKVVRIGSYNDSGAISGATQTVRLPMNSVITKVYMVNNAGSTANTGAFDYSIQTTETTPTILGSVTGSNLSLGFNLVVDKFFECNTETKRTITLKDNATITNIGVCYFLLEYIG